MTFMELSDWRIALSQDYLGITNHSYRYIADNSTYN